MLFGTYEHNIDKKGRLAIPSKLRDELGENFMICRGIFGKRCLCVYSLEQWERFVAKLGELPAAKSSDVKRFLFAGSYNVEFDTQGRILIPATLRDYAQLDVETTIIGVDSNLEIWNSEIWHKDQENNTPEYIASIVEGLGL